MKYRIIFSVVSLLTSSMLVSHPCDGSDRKRKSLPESDQQVIKEVEGEYDGAGKRVKKRSKARDLQETGKEVEEKVKQASKPMDYAGKIVSIGATATGDPHAKMGAAGLKLTIEAVKALGIGIAKTIEITGRYQERSQEILSNAEAILEDLQKSIDKKRKLEKELEDLLNVEKPGQPSESSSRLKQLGQGTKNLAKSAEIKVRQATDLITNDKARRGERIEAIQAELKVENENYAEKIRLLQILLMQDAIKEIDKKSNIEDTIDTLEKNAAFYKDARNVLSSNKKSKQKKQLTEIENKEALNNKELVYYMKYQKSPAEKPDELEKSRLELVNKINELTELSQRGDTLYLQKKEIELDSQINRSVIVDLYKQIDEIKSQLAALGKTTSIKDTTPPGPKQPLETAKSTREPVQKKPAGQATVGDPNLKENIIRQREALRPLPQPPSKVTSN